MKRFFKINRKIRNTFHKRWMLLSLIVVIAMPIVLGVGLYLKSAMLLEQTSLIKLLFSKEWKPMQGLFGLWPFIVSSLWVTILALLIAGPICLLAAIYMTQYTKKYFLRMMHPVIDILAGIPSVVYGVWGVIFVVPLVSNHLAPFFNTQSSGYSILTGAIVLAVMIIPFILNILIEVFRNIPDQLTEASLSLGATHWETVKHVLVRKAFPGIVSAFGLGISRAFGETIAVLMVVGNVTQIPKGIFQPGYPLPALIANNYGEMLSIPLYDSALMLSALVLFVVVLLFNFASRMAIIKLERHT
ncbi:Phosphate transport system permease protein PstC [anaerobic digester metagenome]